MQPHYRSHKVYNSQELIDGGKFVESGGVSGQLGDRNINIEAGVDQGPGAVPETKIRSQ